MWWSDLEKPRRDMYDMTAGCPTGGPGLDHATDGLFSLHPSCNSSPRVLRGAGEGRGGGAVHMLL